MSVYQLYAMTVGTTHFPASALRHDPQVLSLVVGAGNSIDSTIAARRGTRPVVSCTTPDLATALGVCDETGFAITSDAAKKVVLYYGKLVDGGFSTAADNISLTINEGLLALNGVAGDKLSAAQAVYTVYATYDGTNQPFIRLTNVSLPTLTNLGAIYSLFQATINYPTAATLEVAVQEGQFSTGIEPFQERGGSTDSPTYAAIKRYLPRTTITSPSVAAILDVCGINSLKCDSVVLYFAKMGTGSFSSAGGVHVSITGNDSLLTVTSVQAEHNEDAGISLSAFHVEGGGAEPVVIATNASLPTAAAIEELFTAGPIALDGTDFDVLGWGMQLGLTVIHRAVSGNVNPTIAAVSRRIPQFMARALDADQIALDSAAVSVGVFYLRKVEEGATRVADVTAEHVSFTVEGQVYSGGVAGEYGSHVVQNIVLEPVDGGSAIVVIDTTAAIT